MITFKSQFLQLTLSAITFLLVLGALSLIWPGIIALFLGFLLLLQSCHAEQEIAVLSWTEVNYVSIISLLCGALIFRRFSCDELERRVRQASACRQEGDGLRRDRECRRGVSTHMSGQDGQDKHAYQSPDVLMM